jgi:hypothetical protein
MRLPSHWRINSPASAHQVVFGAGFCIGPSRSARYVYSADMSQHQTGFVFNVMHPPPEGILRADRRDIPKEAVLLITPEMGSSRTD